MPDDPAPIPLAYSGPVRGWAGRGGYRARGVAGEAAHLGGTGLAWTFAALVLVAGPLGCFFWATGPVLGFPGLVMMVLFVPVLAAAARGVRRRRADAVLGYLDQAVRLNQPLDRLLAAAARSERGRLSRRLEDLRSALDGGLSLADALAAAVPEVVPRAVGQIAYAEATGRLPQALHRLVRGDVRPSRRPPEDPAFAAWYPPLLLAMAAAILGLIWLFILPKFVQIFHDFGIALPSLTVAMLGSGPWMFGVALVIAALVLVMLGVRLREAVSGDRPSWLMQGPRDRLLYHLPVVGSLSRDRGLADLCDALADAAEQGLPLDAALYRAQRLDLNGVLMARVSRWASGLAQGMDVAAAARAARLPGLIPGLLTTAPPADVPAALRFAARFYGSRFAARRELLVAAYIPVVTVLMGAVVAAVALSLFLPIRDLIDHVEPYMGGGL